MWVLQTLECRSKSLSHQNTRLSTSTNERTGLRAAHQCFMLMTLLTLTASDAVQLPKTLGRLRAGRSERYLLQAGHTCFAIT